MKGTFKEQKKGGASCADNWGGKSIVEKRKSKCKDPAQELCQVYLSTGSVMWLELIKGVIANGRMGKHMLRILR